MRQFFSGNNELAYQNLEVRLNKADIHFLDLELPCDCLPKTAEVGFWIRDHKIIKVKVFEKISYSGQDPIINNWLRNREIKFPDFNSLKDWLTGYLPKVFGESQAREETKARKKKTKNEFNNIDPIIESYSALTKKLKGKKPSYLEIYLNDIEKE
ncbi:MAG: hypothetical protein LBE80_10540 [Deltaproteobacteria bacterium]|jgi:hypothetical protein|nr:hypothetical protein [Deltaproteobacteria bacterium]